MRPILLERAMWLGAVLAGAAAALEWRAARIRPVVPMQVVPSVPAEPRRIAADSLAGSADYVTSNDPFRLSRQPPSVAYSPSLEGLASSPVTRAPRPNLVLRGIVGGPPWSAIIDGIPGRSGSTLLRKGDSLGDLVVRRVGRDTVVIKGADTTWRLTVRRTW